MLIIKKYGGTSLASSERIQRVADDIIKGLEKKHRIAVVVSAQGGETNRLEQLSKALTDKPPAREMDVLLSAGEQVSMSLLAIALIDKGYAAQSFCGFQIPIKTTKQYGRALITQIEPDKLLSCLKDGIIPIIAGFQGIDEAHSITTLGRGGSDLTAVALAVALKADECQIYTDVQGVYTADPRVVPYARLLANITFDEMLELASSGAKVLQRRSVELARRYNIPLRVLSSFEKGQGTLITFENAHLEQPLISGVTFNRDEAMIVLRSIPAAACVAARILEPLSQAHIEVDMIVQNMPQAGLLDFAFTVERRFFNETMHIIKKIAKTLGALEIIGDNRIVKLSLVGIGMKTHSGIASQMFRALSNEGIHIQLISTSEIKVSVIVDEKYLELGVRSLHEAFKLDVHKTNSK